MTGYDLPYSPGDAVIIEKMTVSVYSIPTSMPEADGTIEWHSTTMILVEVYAGNAKGIGYTYGHKAIAEVIDATLKDLVVGKDAMLAPAFTEDMIKAIRNDGQCGIAMMAVSAVDIALWDLKAHVLELPLISLLGKVKDGMLLYGSGGFTSYIDAELENQLAGWVASGINHVKIKIGAEPDRDITRIKLARDTIGTAELFIDANGAYTAKEALQKANEYERYNISWFEEPVPSSDLKGLKLLREHAPFSMKIAAGEYGYNLPYFNAMLEAGAVDVLQGDATRCGGITGFIKAGHLCESYQLPYSSHCAPAVHLHAALSLPAFYIAEFFYDHVRIENMFFKGVVQPVDGIIQPDMTRPGLGLDIKQADAEKYRII
ncbi:MAG: mandelate racemase [Bacteroidetes bacterium]|nr:mandelate racemase [Bacteroidota bacterium]